jgi:hypothetical protein
MPVYLSHKLFVRCRETLMTCNECESHKNLVTVFVVKDLAPLRPGLPEAGTPSERASRCIYYLLQHRLTSGERCALAYFFEVLSELQQEGDALKQELFEVARAVQTEIQDQREQTSEARAYRDAVEHFGLEAAALDPPRGENRVVQWFEAVQQDTDDWAFRIALAVFNGAQYTVFAKAARDLAERLRSTPVPIASHTLRPAEPTTTLPEAPAPIKLTPPGGPLIGRLKAAGATREEKEIVVGDRTEARRVWIVKLDDQTLPSAALTYVWMEYVDWHEPLIEWLTEFAANQPADIRTHAAIAIGVLAIADFATIRQRVLLAWARKEKPAFRAAIAKALGVTVSDPRRENEVRGLLRSWAHSKERALRWAAARAYIYVGTTFPEDALKQWQVIATSEAIRVVEDVEITDENEALIWWKINPLHRSLFSAMQTFFLNSVEQPDRVRPIFEAGLAGLKIWVEADEKAKRAVGEEGLGMIVFLGLSSLLLPSNGPTVEPNAWPPVLLALVDLDSPESHYRTALADLMYRALRAEPDEILDILRLWLERVDQDQRYESQLLAVFHDIVAREGHGRQGRIWNRLMLRLRDWATHKRAPSRTALRVYNRLRIV